MKQQCVLNNKGFVLIFCVLLLPFVTFLFGCVWDIGRMMIIQSHIQSTLDAAGNAGASMIADEIVKIVKEKKDDDPEMEIPEDITNVLTITDRETIMESNEIEKAVQEYLGKNNNHNMTINSVRITYPYNYIRGDTILRIHLFYRHEYQYFFIHFFPKTIDPIEVTSISSMKIQ